MPIGKSYIEFRFLIQTLKADYGTTHGISNSACCSSAIQSTDPERDRLVQCQSGWVSASGSGLSVLVQKHASTLAAGFSCKGVHSSLHGSCLAPAPWREYTSLAPKYSYPWTSSQLHWSWREFCCSSESLHKHLKTCCNLSLSLTDRRKTTVPIL